MEWHRMSAGKVCLTFLVQSLTWVDLIFLSFFLLSLSLAPFLSPSLPPSLPPVCVCVCACVCRFVTWSEVQGSSCLADIAVMHVFDTGNTSGHWSPCEPASSFYLTHSIHPPSLRHTLWEQEQYVVYCGYSRLLHVSSMHSAWVILHTCIVHVYMLHFCDIQLYSVGTCACTPVDLYCSSLMIVWNLQLWVSSSSRC